MRNAIATLVMIISLSSAAHAQGRLRATATSHSVILNWAASTTPGVSYNVYRGPSAAGPFVVISKSVAALTYTDNLVAIGTSYVYYLTAVCPATGCPAGMAAGSEGQPSNQVSVSVGPAGYTFCANENATCAFTGTMSVAFGANGKFNYKNLTGGTACTNAVLGPDPAPGLVKACYTGAVVPTPLPPTVSTMTFTVPVCVLTSTPGVFTCTMTGTVK